MIVVVNTPAVMSQQHFPLAFECSLKKREGRGTLPSRGWRCHGPFCSLKSNSIKKLRNNNNDDDKLCECVAKVDNINKFVVCCQQEEAKEEEDLANMKFH